MATLECPNCGATLDVAEGNTTRCGNCNHEVPSPESVEEISPFDTLVTPVQAVKESLKNSQSVSRPITIGSIMLAGFFGVIGFFAGLFASDPIFFHIVNQHLRDPDFEFWLVLQRIGPLSVGGLLAAVGISIGYRISQRP